MVTTRGNGSRGERKMRTGHITENGIMTTTEIGTIRGWKERGTNGATIRLAAMAGAKASSRRKMGSRADTTEAPGSTEADILIALGVTADLNRSAIAIRTWTKNADRLINVDGIDTNAAGETSDQGTATGHGHGHPRLSRDKVTPGKAEAAADSDSDSDPLSEFVGPLPASDSRSAAATVRVRGRGTVAGASSMDLHFSADYDPSQDVGQPESAYAGDTPTVEDARAEMQRDRQSMLREGAARLKAAGFTDREIAIWTRGGKRDVADIQWTKKR
ncbi:hypothetical protein CMQ_2692 [Grosmannia clavigera kw1407]|uniref:Uncharacterized protein n=1 Tax=Grosmannia clavigera (strain kw1407 / UAMH 11150) TaxID=655863 RepID=F0XHR7_GROCL|nr:uncharacterized protein CMQ_2692 [Grosmannia clavigera kw1407]EFX02763.1 hypothetical protein CMQ_2692 [Grosmannia clavigera kw1407]